MQSIIKTPEVIINIICISKKNGAKSRQGNNIRRGPCGFLCLKSLLYSITEMFSTVSHALYTVWWDWPHTPVKAMNIWTNLAHPREWQVAQTELESEFFFFPIRALVEKSISSIYHHEEDVTCTFFWPFDHVVWTKSVAKRKN